MDLYTIDMETYYDKDYSLSRMQTDAYILDPRFEVIGVGVKRNDRPAVWFPQPQVKGVLDAIPWESAGVLCHNTLFDGFILSQIYKKRPKMWLDTLGMARALYPWLPSHALASLAKYLDLGTKGTEVVDAMGKRYADFTPDELAAYGRYCENDCQLEYDLYNVMADRFPAFEHLLLDLHIRMFTEPSFALNEPKLAAYRKAVLAQKEGLLTGAASMQMAALMVLGDATLKDIVMSDKLFAKALEAYGVDVPMKTSKTTGKPAFAFAKTDKGLTELLEHPDTDVQTLVAARLGVKTTIAETRAQTLVETAQRGVGFPIYLNFFGAKTTGRASGGNKMNALNFPNRGKDRVIREAMEAPPGYRVVVGDSSNIELRTNLVMSGQTDLVDKIKLYDAQGHAATSDLYCDFASDLFGKPVTKADKMERTVGKIACVAEGSLVLTEEGLCPIEQVSTCVRVWDGVEWVNHGGAVLQGVKNVITYQGLTATPDHIVWTDAGGACSLEEAATQGRALVRTGNGRTPLGMGEATEPGFSETPGVPGGVVPVYGMRSQEVGELRQPLWGENKGMPSMLAAEAGPEVVRQNTDRREVPLREPKEPAVAPVRGEGGTVSVPVGTIRGGVGAGAPRSSPTGYGTGSEGQQQRVRSRELAVGDETKKPSEQSGVDMGPVLETAGDAPGGAIRGSHPAAVVVDGAHDCTDSAQVELPLVQTQRRVWDLLDCGPRHRFTVSNVLVHNCLSLGYGAAAVTFQNMLRVQSGGTIVLPLEECERIVRFYRRTHDKVVDLWDHFGRQTLSRIAMGNAMQSVDVNGWLLTTPEGFALPGHIGVVYHDLRRNGDGEWEYQQGRGRVKIYGGKGAENMSQHVARHIVMWQMARFARRYPVALEAYDEVVSVVREDQAPACAEYLLECLRTPPPWTRGLIPLNGEVGIGANYADAKP